VGADLAVDADGRPTNADWEEIAADDPVRRVVCGASTSTLDQRSTRNRGISDAIREREQWLSTAFSSSTTSRASGST
jgi:hypothetical protein